LIRIRRLTVNAVASNEAINRFVNIKLVHGTPGPLSGLAPVVGAPVKPRAVFDEEPEAKPEELLDFFPDELDGEALGAVVPAVAGVVVAVTMGVKSHVG